MIFFLLIIEKTTDKWNPLEYTYNRYAIQLIYMEQHMHLKYLEFAKLVPAIVQGSTGGRSKSSFFRALGLFMMDWAADEEDNLWPIR